MPKKWEKLLRTNSSNYTPILYRCFWMLQYYFVYYERDVCTISHSDKPVSHAASQFIEYFPLTPAKSKSVYSALYDYCRDYTQFFQGNISTTIDLLSLSRIILDTIIEQINLRQTIQLDRIADASFYADTNNRNITEIDQFAQFQKYIDGFGRDTYDRYQMLIRFAAENCYAADELATMYYWGKTYWIRDNNYFELEQNYEKSAEWCIKAIENSNPPLQNSCWTLSNTLIRMHYDNDREQEIAEKKAIEYLRLAGDYPAAYNKIAWFLFRDAEKQYKEHGLTDPAYEEILIQFLSAIRLADKAGNMHWYYGNNQIALFLMRHKEDAKLISDLSKRLSLHIPFDTEAQLRYSASYHNLWALKYLALYLLENGKSEEARSLLQEAMDANYNPAFYETAVHFYKTGTSEWLELMEKASGLSYSLATYELAANEKDQEEKKRLIDLCKQQLLTEKDLNVVLLEKLNAL